MSWNYRIIKGKEETGLALDYYRVGEVHYNDDEEIEGWTEGPVKLVGETPEGIQEDLILIRAAFHRPVLTEADGKLS
tara:strand:+ start:241 stop:471 length:231 start_codon:yes stop_codon:yes gene_type:complete